jgi:UDP-N-acetylglucosamine acyltransferase
MSFNKIDDSFIHGKNFEIGCFNRIHEDVRVGDDVTIKSYVELRPHTVIGDNCYVDSGVRSSGRNKIGNNVVIRYNSILARGTLIHDDVFVSPQLMTENVSHEGNQIGGAEIGVGEWRKGDSEYRVFIGTNVTLASGIKVCSGAVIGSKTNVRKDILEPGVYVGNPAKKIR